MSADRRDTTLPKPPVAKRVPVTTEVHGERRVDEYHWLRDDAPKVKRPEVMRHLEAENAYTAAVLAPTEPAQRGTIARFRLDPARVLLQEPVTEPRELVGPNARGQFGLQPQHRVVGITARIQPHRRFDLLWETAARVTKALPDARFVLLGRGNEVDTRALVTEPIQGLGLQGHVVLPGYQKGAAYEAALCALDAFLFLVPGSDGTCRAVCDAMAFGLPVVTTRAGILPELMASRRAGEVPGVATDDRPEVLAGELLRLLRDDGLRARTGAAALARARLDMDPLRAALRTRALYGELLAARGAR